MSCQLLTAEDIALHRRIQRTERIEGRFHFGIGHRLDHDHWRHPSFWRQCIPLDFEICQSGHRGRVRSMLGCPRGPSLCLPVTTVRCPSWKINIHYKPIPQHRSARSAGLNLLNSSPGFISAAKTVSGFQLADVRCPVPSVRDVAPHWRIERCRRVSKFKPHIFGELEMITKLEILEILEIGTMRSTIWLSKVPGRSR